MTKRRFKNIERASHLSARRPRSDKPWAPSWPRDEEPTIHHSYSTHKPPGGPCATYDYDDGEVPDGRYT